MLYYLYTDGGARSNPGPAGVGIVIQNNKKETLERFSAYIGRATNNQAEYRALIIGLGKLSDLVEAKDQATVVVYLDSELLVKQLAGEYRVKNKQLKPLYEKVQKMIREFKSVSFSHTPRAGNKEADKLVNQAIDAAVRGRPVSKSA